MKAPICRLFLSGLSALILSRSALAEVTPASLFTDHTVLQEGTSVPIWGTAAPSEAVTVTFGDQKQATSADPDGHWMVKLNDLKPGEPRDLVIAGTNTVALHDVLVGEVWLCSGQSNMDFTVAKTPKFSFAGVRDEEKEVAAANYPEIRMFSGQWTKSYTPQSTIKGEWKLCTPENVREFSAIGYFFARDLQKELKVPVGIVTMTFGASTAQAWIRREALAADPEMNPLLTAFDAAVQQFRSTPPATAPAAAVATSQPTTRGTGRSRGNRGPRDPVQDQHQPTVMYNGMIAPAIPYAIKGVLWYQGESITAPRELFPKLNETLIKDWRQLWGYDFPFYFVQLAAQDANSNSPVVREMQAQALSLPNTAMAVTVDIGERKNVHPKNKQDVGDRLTRIALAKTYGKPIEYSGPVYDSMKVEGHTIRLAFTHANGLMAKDSTDGELKTFTIAGSDGKFVPATAKIDGNSVVVSSPEVADPASVRYAWSNFPEGPNLYNSDQLPAPPFRTDHLSAQPAAQ